MSASKWWLAVFAVAALCGYSVAQQALTPYADVRLELKDSRTQFAIGEPITLELVFTSDTPGYAVNTVDYGDIADDVQITPAEGWFRSHGRSGHDFLSTTELRDKPIRVPVLLNQGVVFEKPGQYQVSITTGRLLRSSRDFGGLSRTTNSVTISITAPDDRAEAELVQSLSNQIATERGEPRHQAAVQLAFLGGDDAIRTKVHWLLEDEDEQGDRVQREMLDGLASSRNLALQLDLLNAAWLDSQRVPDDSLLQAIEQTRAFERKQTLDGWQMAGTPKTDEASNRAAEERRHDLSEIVATLPQRTGANRRDTAYFLMESSALSQADQLQVRPVVLEEFGRMDSLSQAMLLETRWKEIRDPALVPDLRNMLDTPAAFREHPDAIQRLIELSPQTARPYVLREICDPKSAVPLEKIADLPDETLPEADACLTAQLQTATGPNNLQRRWKAPIAARFGTQAILPAMWEIYKARRNWNPQSDDAAFLAYLLRYSPKAISQIDALGADAANVFFEIDRVFEARKAQFPADLDAWLRQKVRKGSDHDAGWAAYQLSRFGAAEDKSVIEQRLETLRKAWQERTAELETPRNSGPAAEARMLETDLVTALVSAPKLWTVTPDETANLLRGCLTSLCKSHPQ